MNKLTLAADSLIGRLKVLEISSRTLPLEAWNEVDKLLPGYVPAWYRKLLSTYPLMDPIFDVPSNDDHRKNVEFRTPEEILDDEDDDEGLRKGWFLFAYSTNGDMWGMKTGEIVDSPIIHVVHTRGGIHSNIDDVDSIEYASHNLAYLIASFTKIFPGHPPGTQHADSVDPRKNGIKLWGEEDSFLSKNNIQNPRSRLKQV